MLKIYFLLLALFGLFASEAIGQGRYPEPFEVENIVYKNASKYYDLQTASQALYKMIILKPYRKDLNDSLALLYYSAERYAQAKLVGEEILSTNPNNTHMREIVAFSNQNLGMMKESLADYEKLYAAAKSVYYLYQIATLQYQLKRLNECISSVDLVINNDAAYAEKVDIRSGDSTQKVPINAAAYNVKGICETELGHKHDAITYFKKALKIYPDFALAAANLQLAQNGGKTEPGEPNKISELADVNTLIHQNFQSEDVTSERHVENESPKSPKTITQEPPFIAIKNNDLKFIDHNGNNEIDANENSKVAFTIVNSGKGEGRDMVIKLSAKGNTSGISFDQDISIPTIKPGASYEAEVYLHSNINTENGSITFNIKVEEPHGFGSDPVELEVPTKAFLAPKVEVVDYSVTSQSGPNLARKQPFDLQILVQNKKPGLAENVTVDIILPDNVWLLSGEQSVNIGSLKGGGTKELLYNVAVTDHYTSKDIPITIKLKERYGKYAEDKTISLSLNQTLATNKLTIQSTVADKPVEDIQEASLRAEVDKNIPQSSIKNINTYALIIGNEDYTKHQSGLSSEANVAFANNDAQIFSTYCNKTLGIPGDNITLLPDATAGEMKQNIDKMKTLIKNSDGKLQVIFYYAGHGQADEVTHDSYIIPVDISGKDLSSAIKLSDVYHSLTTYPSKGVIVFLDACFSGSALLADRAIRIKPKMETLNGRITIFAATSKDQTSWPYKDKQHGMFTYYLLKKLQESRADISLADLGSYLNKQVKFQSVKINSKEQEPQLIHSDDITDSELAKVKFPEGFK